MRAQARAASAPRGAAGSPQRSRAAAAAAVPPAQWLLPALGPQLATEQQVAALHGNRKQQASVDSSCIGILLP